VQKNQSTQVTPSWWPSIRSFAVPQEPGGGDDDRLAGPPVGGGCDREGVGGLQRDDDAVQLVEVAAEAERVVDHRTDDPSRPRWRRPGRRAPSGGKALDSSGLHDDWP
jgi:hypothetical protein